MIFKLPFILVTGRKMDGCKLPGLQWPLVLIQPEYEVAISAAFKNIYQHLYNFIFEL